jgi:glycosyltransferase involved in cell wall biosynthesis
MYRGRSIAVVIPCYQVARHIRTVVNTLPDIVDHVVLVDDGSTDRLHEELRDVQRPGMIVLRHDRNRGLARAMVTGLRAAVDSGADIIVKMDGDGQMDPLHLGRLLRPIARQEADFTKGNRFVHRRDLHGMPRVRLIGNMGLSFMTKFASGYWTIFDPTNGYIAMRREVVEALDLNRLGPGYFFETSMLVEVYLTGAVVKDVSIPSRYADEESSLSPGRILVRFPWLLLRAGVRRILIRYFLRDFTPVALFAIAGGLLTAVGAVFGAHEWYQRYGTGIPTPTGTILLAVLPLLTGFQLLVQAVVMDIASVPQKSPWIDATEELVGVAPRPADRVNDRLPLTILQSPAATDERRADSASA